MNLGEVITTSDHIYNVKSYHITLMIMYMDKTGHISNKPHCNTTISVEKGQKSCFGWIYTNCLNETKKGGETSKSKILRI